MAAKKKGRAKDRPSPRELRHRQLLCRLLACSLPEAEAGAIVERLFEVFGSFRGIVTAPPEELTSQPFMPENAGRMLALLLELAREIMEERAADLLRIYDIESAVDAFLPKFLGRKTEAVCVILLDGKGQVLYNNIVVEGSVSEVPMYVRRLVGLCIEYDASCVLLAHNHPSGNALPSRNDLVATRQIEIALRGIDVSLQDHLIFAGNDHFSFAESSIWEEDQEWLQSLYRTELQKAREKELEFLEQG